MAAGDVLPFPVYGYNYRVGPFPIFDNDGDLVTGAAGLDSEVSKNFAAYSDCTNEATEIGSSGMYYLDLTSTEMTAIPVSVIVKTSTTDAKTSPITILPRKLPVFATGTAQAGAAGTITLASGASAIDDDYTGMYVGITSGTGAGQLRTVMNYVGSTKVASVEPDWGTTPDNTSVYAVIDPINSINIRAHGDDAVTGWAGEAGPTAAEVADAVWDELKADHVVPDSFGDYLDDEVSTIGGGSLTEAGIADAVLDELIADHVISGSLGDALTDILGASGVTLTDIFDTTLTEVYSTVTAELTLRQFIYDVEAYLFEKSRSGTTISIKERDGTTQAMTIVVDDADDVTTWSRGV
jgi:hypothetical protein